MFFKKFLLEILHLLEKWVKSDNFFLSLFLILSIYSFIDVSIDVVTKDEIIYYDHIIVNFLNDIATRYSAGLAISITRLGSEYIIFLLLPLVSALLFFRYIREAVLLLLATGGSYFWNIIVKSIFDRARPVVGTPIIQPDGYSYPSGHAMISTCFYGTLIYLSFRYIKNQWLRNFACLFFGFIIFIIGLSRVYLGVHYPSDVLGGFMLGLFWLCLCILAYKIIPIKISKE